MSEYGLSNDDSCQYYQDMRCRTSECSQCGIYYRYKQEADYRNKMMKKVEVMLRASHVNQNN